MSYAVVHSLSQHRSAQPHVEDVFGPFSSEYIAQKYADELEDRKGGLVEVFQMTLPKKKIVKAINEDDTDTSLIIDNYPVVTVPLADK